jgi:uncharacterized protein YbjT (DUF2867 family)
MKIVSILGGSGFVGHAIVRQLSEAGYCVKVLTRNCHKAKHLTKINNVQVIECNVLSDNALKQSIQSSGAVINLVGILHESNKVSFESIHADLPKRLAEICESLGIPRLIHMSALQASGQAPSNYLRSKAKGEQYIAEHNRTLNITIFKPSVIFGPCDNFINLFAKLIRFLPVIAIAKPNAKFQPVYVEDVASAFVQALENKLTFGKTFDLVGPKIYSLRELIELVANTLQKKRLIIGLNDQLSYLQAWGMELLPVKMMTRDNVRSMELDSTSHQQLPEYFMVKPQALEAVLQTYIKA